MLKRGLPYIISMLVFVSCEKPILSEIDNLNNNQIFKIGHGGMGFPFWFPFNSLPTNSMAAIKKAIEDENADGVEIDVHMTSDFEFVLYHDKMLDSKTSKQGYPEELKLNEIVGVEYQLGFPYDLFQKERLISLDTALNYFKSLDSFPIVQLDLRNYCENFLSKDNDIWEQKMQEKLLEKLNSFDLDSRRIHLISISKKMCLFFKENSDYKVSIESIYPEEALEIALNYRLNSITIRGKEMTKAITQKAHENGIEVITFGSKSRSGNLEFNPLQPRLYPNG